MAQPTPFPGMDPYLEHRLLWPGFHTRLMVEMGKLLAPRLRPRYAVSVEERVVLEPRNLEVSERVPDLWVQRLGAPASRGPAEDGGGVAVLPETDVVLDTPVVVEFDTVEVRQRYLEVLDLYRDQRVVTVIEVLSPSNKRGGRGRDAYLEKQQATLASECHLVEVDLLRHGQPTLALSEFRVHGDLPGEYRVCVNRHPHRQPRPWRFELYSFTLRDRLPRFAVPLADPDPDVPLDLQAAFAQVYEDSSYMLRVKYDDPCVPPLEPDAQQWADECRQAYRQAHAEWFPPTGEQPVPDPNAAV